MLLLIGVEDKAA
ncbi:06d66a1b-5a4c-4a74-abb8-c533c80e75dd [Thermothielavioides terrestris]|uniref:06d66a1b-5a4c-4a74-abb8-c533c80e75dd n=1 Tax=Thermothielavioides terrestris TaxID=2587410 RepID=A0A446BRK9_9PEZI|nr:06d66a1b-5a4c-4a74-abb8-c533c80e75dd [Thermothielavioides terrestris]